MKNARHDRAPRSKPLLNGQAHPNKKQKLPPCPLPGDAPPAPLSSAESREFQRCEQILEEGLQTFFEVGHALLTIRNGRLYRTTHDTFEDYCHERWAISRSYAWRVIGAAERMVLLPPDPTLPKPSNEFQVRPFLKLEPSRFPEAWTKAVAKAKGGRVTPALVNSLLAELGCRPPSHRAKPKVSNGSRLGRILVLLHQAKKCMQAHDSEGVTAALDQVENVLFEREMVEEFGRRGSRA